MKWFAASDIHGSALYCRQMLEAYRKEGADRLLLLGDILYHGPRNALPNGYDPKRTAEMLCDAKNEILCVRGNCDSEVDQMMLDFPILTEYAAIGVGQRLFYAVHGHREQNLPLHAGDVLICGHTHVPRCEEREGILYLNPGSVSIPKENSARGYLILKEDAAVFKKLDGTPYRECAFRSSENNF